MKRKQLKIIAGTVALALCAAALTTACSGSSSGYTRSHMHYGAGYRGYYRDPWRYGPGYIGGGVGPGIGHEPPMATQLPDMGMPDFGGMDMDMGGFDF